MKKIIQTIFSFGLAVSMLAIAPLASANYSMNSLPNDCKTVTIGNRTTGAGINSTCWNASSVSAVSGNEVVVSIYYNNSGTSSAQNVTFKVTDVRNQTVGRNGSISITGQLSVGGTVIKSETVSLTNSSNLPLRMVAKDVTKITQSNRTDVSIQGGSAIFSGSGLSIGNVSPGWTNQGVVKTSFTLQSVEVGPIDPDPNTFSQHPTVSTTNISGLQNATGTVTLNGYFNANGSSTSTYFRYRKLGGNWITTASQSHGNTSGNISRQVTGLADGNYEYQACATNSSGTKCGKYNSSIDDSNFVIRFSIENDINNDDDNDDDNNGNIDRPEVVTNSATSIDEDSATLRGNLEDDGNDTVSLWFEYGRDDDNLNQRTNAGSRSSAGSFSKNISGLRENTRYYFRACGENDEATDCGSIRSFVTQSDVNDDDNDDDNDSDYSVPTVSTLGTVAIGSTTATIDGYFSANGCQATTRFEYGTTTSLGSVSTSTPRIYAAGSMVQNISGLTPNATYYYRAVATNCMGTSVGAVQSFTTAARTVVNPGPVVTGGTGGSFIRLMITNNRDVVRQGREVAYDLAWENVSGRDLNNLVLEVNFPEQLIITETERGQITRSGNSVIYKIPSLARRESGEMTIYTEVRTGLREGDPVVAQAIMAFENPTTNATENAIAYDADEYSLVSGAGLGASLFGLGFFPTSLAGWLLILLIIILIVLAVRYFNRRNTVAVVNQVPAQAPYPGAPAQDYVVYRPNPKQ